MKSAGIRVLAAGLTLLAACTADMGTDGDVGLAEQNLGSSPDTTCTSGSYGGHDYWFCSTQRNWQTARTKCQAVGLDLAAISSSGENQFVLGKVSTTAWLGATDSVAEGAWRWADTNTQFWQGSATGSSVAGSFANWTVLQPDNFLDQDCGSFSGGLGLGKWTDEPCSGSRGYVCEGIVDQCPSDPNKLVPGQCGCGNLDTDTDGDGAADCVDGCPSDNAKSAAGQCGCGAPETDSDADGTADCVDLCPADGGKSAPGQCGCGTPDTDSDSDGTANCKDGCATDGARTAPPCSPDASCSTASYSGHAYWFCSTSRDWQTARAKCQAQGIDLATIDASNENEFVRSHIAGDSWIGANDTAVEGTWRWAQSGTQFWQGTFTGNSIGGAYRNWAPLQPDNLLNQDCGVQSKLLGTWDDQPCGGTRAYVCEGDLCPSDPNKTAPGQCGCGNPDDDTDADGFASCKDACSADPAKTDPGFCGCGVPDTDTDNDGVPDCDDLCPQDAARTDPGDCGCANAPRPAGTACSDGLCAANTQCNGAGSCGSASQCAVPDAGCTSRSFAGRPYWFCSLPRPFAEARQRCQAAGMDLSVVESAAEDNFIGANLAFDAFLGGSDQSAEGTWTWLRTGAPFWTGDQHGTAVRSAYENWELGEPSGFFGASRDCLVKDPAILFGQWETADCSLPSAYVCERTDLCPDDPMKLDPGACGCGAPDIDTDADGTPDCNDGCPWDPQLTAPGVQDCGAPSCQGSESDLTPQFHCITTRADGTKNAVFFVNNTSSCFVTVAYGATNQFSPSPAERGQPTLFFPGSQHAVTTPISGTLSWTLGSRTAVASEDGPDCSTFVEQLPSPVRLTSSQDPSSGLSYPGHKTTTGPITFKLPDTLPVLSGNAANGTATLSYREPAGTLVTCTYRGQSSSAQPQDDLNFARGLSFKFVSCSNGKHSGDSVIGTEWDLSVQGGDSRLGITAAKVDLGVGCSGSLPPALTPEETVQLRQGFDWAATTSLPETTVEPGIATPLPAMYYAMIYIDGDDQIDVLNGARVFYRQLPIFPSELDKYAGTCGTIDGTGDMRGQFVFAILPATAYNYIRSQSIGAGANAPFRAIVLRSIPDANLRNPDGTLSWKALRASGFNYFPTQASQLPYGYTSTGGAIAALAPLIDNAWTGGNFVLGDGPGYTQVINVRLQLSIVNLDPMFKTAHMRRGWSVPSEMNPHGATLEVLWWGSKGSVFGRAELSKTGKAKMFVPVGNDVRGSGLCIHLENNAGMIISGKTVLPACDFRGVAKIFGSFRHDIPVRKKATDPVYLEIDNGEGNTNLLTQATDGADYMRYVAHAPIAKPARVMVGYWSTFLGVFNHHRSFTPCFNFSANHGLIDSALEDKIGSVGAGLVDFFTGNLDDNYHMRRDIYIVEPVFPEPDALLDSDDRGLMTHEYGHYVMCDAFNNVGRLRPLYNARVIDEAFGEEATDNVGISMESWADFFASQLTSSVNYPNLTFHAVDDHGTAYCKDRSCLEKNYHGEKVNSPELTTPYQDRIARNVSTFYDGFDTARPWRGVGDDFTPTNSDAWLFLDLGFVQTFLPGGGYASSYSPSDVDDEPIQLPGSAIHDWLVNASQDITNDPEFGIRRALANASKSRYSWCQICDMFAIHESGITSTSNVQDRWAKCQGQNLLQIVGFAPDPSLNMDANTCMTCGSSAASGDDGVCVACDINQRKHVVGHTCEQCPSGYFVADDNTCQACDEHEITNGNTCVLCPGTEHANRSTNKCEACPADITVDAGTFDDHICGKGFFDVDFQSSASDFCPEEIWVEVQNVNALQAGGTNPSRFEILMNRYKDISELGCPNNTEYLSVNEDVITSSGSSTPGFAFVTPSLAGQVCDLNFGPCPATCQFSHFPLGTHTAQYLSDTNAQTLRIRIALPFTTPASDPAINDVFVTAPDLCPHPL